MSLSSLLRGLLHAALSAVLATAALFHPHSAPPAASAPSAPAPAIATSSAAVRIPTTQTTATSAPNMAKKPVPSISAPTLEPKSAPAAVAPAPAPVQPPPAAEATPASLSSDEVNTLLRKSLVNILCTTASGGYFRPISGSGIIIDTRGVILTNAHVAQYFLLKDYGFTNNVSCVIRTGSPAQARYTAKLLYLPPAWIKANATQIRSSDPQEDGENDYAFLLITGSTSGAPLPASFPAIPLTIDDPVPGLAVVAAAYPAQFLGGTSIQLELYASSAVTEVPRLYTFTTSSIDAFSVGSTIVSQSGSSGGGVARVQDGALIGLIATASAGTTTATRDLHAISLSYIDRSLKEAGQGGIAPFLLNGGLEQKVQDFNTNIAPGLTKELEDALK